MVKDLRKGYQAFVGRVDWASKLWLLENFREAEKLDWDDPWLKNLDLEYHNVDLQAGLYHGLAEEGDMPRFTTNDLVNLSKHTPSRNTRDLGRSEVNEHVVKEGWDDFLEQTAKHQDPRRPPYFINWSVLQLQGSPPFVMADPFRTYVQESRDYCSGSGVETSKGPDS